MLFQLDGFLLYRQKLVGELSDIIIFGGGERLLRGQSADSECLRIMGRCCFLFEEFHGSCSVKDENIIIAETLIY